MAEHYGCWYKSCMPLNALEPMNVWQVHKWAMQDFHHKQPSLHLNSLQGCCSCSPTTARAAPGLRSAASIRLTQGSAYSKILATTMVWGQLVSQISVRSVSYEYSIVINFLYIPEGLCWLGVSSWAGIQPRWLKSANVEHPSHNVWCS